MSSPESSSTDAADSKPRGSAVSVVITLALLGGFVWAIRPSQPNFTPAPLDQPSSACPRSKSDFVPTNLTEVSGLALAGLPDRARNRALLRLNMEPCSCGCGLSLAACRLSNPSCAISARDATVVVQDEVVRPGANSAGTVHSAAAPHPEP